MKWINLAFLLIFVSCTTIVGRDLPITKVSTYSSKERPSLIISSSRTKLFMNKNDLINYFLGLNLFKKVEIVDGFEYVNKDISSSYDLHLELDFISGGFFEAWCLMTLLIVPCTPPVEWVLGAKIGGKKINPEKTYILKESATEIVWALGPLVPGFGKGELKEKDLKINMLNNLINKLLEDKVIN